MLWIMLNPSTADEHTDDPTIRKCVGFAKEWGFGGIMVCNLFALRATDPRELLKHPNPEGLGNQCTIIDSAYSYPDIVCAWGTRGSLRGVGHATLDHLREYGHTPTHLGLTKNGHPRHPLYLSYATERIEWP